MASNPYVNKVEYDGSTVMDITDTTATASDVAAGKVFYAASGERTTGTNSGGITLDDVYPVGSIYMSVNNTNPGTLFGGTWQAIEDTFLLAAGTNHAGGSTGGEETVQLTEDETPVHAHTHSMTQPAFTLPNHVHETANSMVVYNNASSVTTRMATSGSGTKISLNNALANNLNTYNPTTTPACTRSTNAAVNARVYPSGESASTVDAHNNMPPYLAVYVWKRTA